MHQTVREFGWPPVAGSSDECRILRNYELQDVSHFDLSNLILTILLPSMSTTVKRYPA